MRKSLLLLTFFLALTANQAGAGLLLSDLDDPLVTLTNESSYWAGGDFNGFFNDQLRNANPRTEEAWLEALLGYVYDEPIVSYIDRISAGEIGLGKDDKQLLEYDPGFAWDYAVVKYGKYWIAYEDDNNDELLTTDKFPREISHITFFDPPAPLSTSVAVPEPASLTLYLVGFGLAGLLRRGRKK